MEQLNRDGALEKAGGPAYIADLSGEVVISSPEPDDDLDYALFGFGALVRISLQPGTHGAAVTGM